MTFKPCIALSFIALVAFSSCKKGTTDKEYAESGILSNSGEGTQSSFKRILKGNDVLSLNGVSQTSDGGYLIVGMATNNISKFSTTLLTKVNQLGEQVWSKQINDFRGRTSILKEEFSNNYLLSSYQSGQSSSDLGKIMKISDDGSILWTKQFSQEGILSFNVFHQTDDQGYLGFGNIELTSRSFVVKFDQNGELLWKKEIGVPVLDGAGNDNNGFYLCGRIRISNDSSLSYLMAFDQHGDELNSPLFEGDFIEQLTRIKVDSNGDIYVLGNTTVNPVSWFLRKLSSTGQELWSRAIEKDGIPIRSYALTIDNQGNPIVAGHSNPSTQFPGVVVKFNSAGDLLYANSVSISTRTSFEAISFTADNGCILAGAVQFPTSTSGAVVKLNADGQ